MQNKKKYGIIYLGDIMVYEMKLQDIYFEKIKNQTKVYEVRLNDEKRRLLDTGDTIIFRKNSNPNEYITTQIEDLIYFDSFEAMAYSLAKEKIGFENESIKEIVDVYHQFYSEEDEEKYGVVAINVKLINN